MNRLHRLVRERRRNHISSGAPAGTRTFDRVLPEIWITTSTSAPWIMAGSQAGHGGVEHRRPVAELLPALLGEVRGERRQHHHQVLHDPPLADVGLAERVDQLHQRRDRGVVGEVSSPSVTRFLVWFHLTTTGRCSSPPMAVARADWSTRSQTLSRNRLGPAMPQSRKSPPFLERPQEHQVHPEGVGAPPGDVLVGDDDVAPRLRHLGPVLHDQCRAPGTSGTAPRSRRCPRSWSTMVTKREYSRWSTACSLPPM